MKKQVWTLIGAIVAGVFALAMAFSGNLQRAAVWAVAAAGAGTATRVWSRKDPIPMPYFMRWVLFVPRGPHSPAHLERILQPRTGNRILEIGAGVGIHALPVASSVLPDGTLDVLDIQQEMLADLKRQAAKVGATNIIAIRGDAQRLPYAEGTFDAAYLIGVLGEIPDPNAALRELRRVLKPGGRLVLGEVLIDPDFISLSTLQEKAATAGLLFERRTGPAFSYLAAFRPATGVT